MGMYDNDPRVQQVSDSEYRIVESDKNCGWTIREEGGAWTAYDPSGTPSRIVCGMSTADGAIAAITGDPR